MKQEKPQPPHINKKEEEPHLTHIKEEVEELHRPHIKEEEKEYSNSQNGEHLEGMEVDISKIPLNGVIVKIEDDEVKSESEKREVEPPSSSSTQHMTTEDDGDHCGGSQADKLLAPLSDSDDMTSHSPETDDKDSEADTTCHTDNTHFECPHFGKTFNYRCNLKTHTGLYATSNMWQTEEPGSSLAYRPTWQGGRMADISCSAAQVQILTLLETIKHTQDQLVAKVNFLTSRLTSTPGPEVEMLANIQFPLEQLEEVEAFEAFLKEPSNGPARQRVISSLATIGGQDVKRVTWNILGRIFTDKVAHQINWKGVNNKKAFSRMATKTLLFSAVRKNVLTGSATDAEVTKHAIRWFNLAADRAARRRVPPPPPQTDQESSVKKGRKSTGSDVVYHLHMRRLIVRFGTNRLGEGNRAVRRL
ncbi:uncharacterized protein LOC133663640 isoform X2 [Entelurus aequoreus]|uniref:uncharacterized protein LOC133663640 isoform X2 n=1 Tax=Entelurus aequoreus TaxID=161455 RepID=UPI002B1E134A|nr:uncharacterized protein LOC133663640 isoform X2 [Entelurus aequoreus]